MQIHLWQAVLIGIIYYLGYIGTPWLTLMGGTTVMRPLVGGTLVGIVLGDPVQGCIIGAAINLPYLAFITAGGTSPVDPGLAGILGTALGIAANVSPNVAITLAIPLGLLGTIVWVTHMTIDIAFVHMADVAAEKGELKKIIYLYHIILPQICIFLLCVIPVTLASYFGSGAVKGAIDTLGGTPLHILTVIGGILPALGIAMNLKAIGRKETILFFMLGFLSLSYFKLTVLVISVFAFIVAYIYTQLLMLREGGNA
ncbi:MAG: PTS sugar transporter subunit IIC [Clostridium sp.]|nr:PTS sugar transporter subunit IIC [Clostridium sp.]MCH3965112.1 PTS sugar transporter subunit IIC [Clostridium sp.]MCI1714333.1 PTS sugar transporter subunit IIC [Clostridium sp.]MCI1798595.1 PTS sugar transporter subunit IIC [Clostridium sp.]MCI1812674.1 PTS sugar transporter subunit IIC [Clostridium sp.]MCI1869404.1 PTS sugar transporter subunit IIC [Clostridium sp.]